MVVVFDAFKVRLLSCVHSTIWLRYGCICCCAVWWFEWEDSMVMSSAYVTTWTEGGGVGRSEVYMLNSVGERTDPCGTPVLICCCLE